LERREPGRRNKIGGAIYRGDKFTEPAEGVFTLKRMGVLTREGGKTVVEAILFIQDKETKTSQIRDSGTAK